MTNSIFNQNWYLNQYTDVKEAGVDPEFHYDTYGWLEGRDASPFFDTSYYLSANEDVAAAEINPLDHYLASGGFEGRDPSENFDSSFYLSQNADVQEAGINPLFHFLAYGASEGRLPFVGFSEAGYLTANPDVDAAVQAGTLPSGLYHFANYGLGEGRSGADTAISGKAIDGYIQGATVFADANGDGVWTPGEVKTLTDAQGNFTLEGGKGDIIVMGGTDTSTGEAFKGVMSAPEGATVVNPLTTLQKSFMDKGLTAAQAQEKVGKALGIDVSTVNLIRFDMLHTALDADAEAGDKALATGMQAQAAKIINFLVAGAATLCGAAGGTGNISAQKAMEALVSAMADTIANDEDGVIDMTDKGFLKSVISGSVDVSGNESLISAKDKVSAMEDSFAAMMADSAKNIDEIIQKEDNTAKALVDIARVSSFAQNEMAGKMEDAADTGSLDHLVDDYTGDSADQGWQDAPLVDLDPSSSEEDPYINKKDDDTGGGSTGGDTTKTYSVASGKKLTLTSDEADNNQVTGEGSVIITPSDGNQTLTIQTEGSNRITPGQGADTITLGKETGKDFIIVQPGSVSSHSALNTASAAAQGASITFSNIKTSLSTGDTITFKYNNKEYTATLTNGNDKTNLQNDINTALGKDKTNAGDVLVSYSGEDGNLVLTAAGDISSDTLTGGKYKDVTTMPSNTEEVTASPAHLTFTDTTRMFNTEDTIAFTYNDKKYTAKLTNGRTGLQKDINTALKAGGADADDVLASFTGKPSFEYLVLTASDPADTLEKGEFVDIARAYDREVDYQNVGYMDIYKLSSLVNAGGKIIAIDKDGNETTIVLDEDINVKYKGPVILDLLKDAGVTKVREYDQWGYRIYCENTLKTLVYIDTDNTKVIRTSKDTESVPAKAASATYSGIQSALSTGDTITFTYDDTEYTATLTGGTSNLDTDIDMAIKVDNLHMLGSDKVTASVKDGDLILTADDATISLTGGAFADNDLADTTASSDTASSSGKAAFTTYSDVKDSVSSGDVLVFTYKETQYTAVLSHDSTDLAGLQQDIENALDQSNNKLDSGKVTVSLDGKNLVLTAKDKTATLTGGTFTDFAASDSAPGAADQIHNFQIGTDTILLEEGAGVCFDGEYSVHKMTMTVKDGFISFGSEYSYSADDVIRAALTQIVGENGDIVAYCDGDNTYLIKDNGVPGEQPSDIVVELVGISSSDISGHNLSDFFPAVE